MQPFSSQPSPSRQSTARYHLKLDRASGFAVDPRQAKSSGRASRASRTLALLLTLVFCLPAPAARAADEPSLREMAGQLLMVGFRGLELKPDAPLARDIRELKLGGVILFDFDLPSKSGVRNIESPEQLARLVGQLKAAAGEAGAPPLFIAVDAEGGRVNRLKPKFGFPDPPSAASLGRQEPAASRAAGELIGGTLAAAGINLDFAPVLDVNANPDNPVIGKLERSFSGQAEAVAARGQAFIDGLHARGVLAAVKHFPGHGSSRQDSHLGVTDISWTWNEAELIPFRKVIAAGAADMVMTGHLFNAHLDPDHPATLSRRVITNLLRRDLGFKGVVVSDDMQMKAITAHYGLEKAVELALNAGVDVLLFGNNLEYDPNIAGKAVGIIERLVATGKVSKERVREAYGRISTLKNKTF